MNNSTQIINCPNCGCGLNVTKASSTTTDAPAQPPVEKPQRDLKLAKCNRCGETDLCWQASMGGNYYLCKTRKEGDRIVPLRKEFHVCTGAADASF